MLTLQLCSPRKDHEALGVIRKFLKLRSLWKVRLLCGPFLSTLQLTDYSFCFFILVLTFLGKWAFTKLVSGVESLPVVSLDFSMFLNSFK